MQKSVVIYSGGMDSFTLLNSLVTERRERPSLKLQLWTTTFQGVSRCEPCLYESGRTSPDIRHNFDPLTYWEFISNDWRRYGP